MRENLLLLLVFFVVFGCVGKKKQEEIKQIIYLSYPSFESNVQDMITQKYGDDLFKKSKWEWQIKQSRFNNEFEVKYGCFRELSIREDFVGGAVEEFTGELSLGFVKYNPKSKNKGVYLKLIVNTKDKSIRF